MKRITTWAAVAVLAVIGAVIAPTAATAHTGNLHVTAVCNVQTGHYDLTATLTTASTPLTGETRWRIGTPNFEGTPSSASGMDRGPITTTGAQTVTLETFSLPGTTTGYGPWVYAFTRWSDRYSVGSDGQLTKKLDGKCAKPTPPAQPDDKVTYTDWADEAWGCGDIETLQTREKSVTTHVWDEKAWAWIAHEPTVTTETQTRTLTEGERLTWQTADPDAPCFDRPDAPDPTVETEQRTSDPACVIPENGFAEVVVEERERTLTPVWNEAEQRYDMTPGDWSDWALIDAWNVETAECDPPAPTVREDVEVTPPSCDAPWTTTVTTLYETPKVWDEGRAEWVDGEEAVTGVSQRSDKMGDEWVEANCAEEPEPPADDPETSELVSDPEDDPELAVTGSDETTRLIGGLAGGTLALGGLILGMAAYRRSRSRK